MGVAYLEGADPVAANRHFATSTDPYDLRFKEELKKILPPIVDFSKPLEGIEEIFDSTKVASRPLRAGTGRPWDGPSFHEGCPNASRARPERYLGVPRPSRPF